MVIIRESPRAKTSPNKPQSQWPPASPFQALLSSPGGRRKWQDLQQQTRSRSASPSKRIQSRTTLEVSATTSDDDANVVEDEEVLQLKLEILQTKQKLQELTRKKREQREQGDRNSSRSPSKRRRLATNEQDTTFDGVQVPVSPSRASASAILPVSPARVRLGILGDRAEKVSLKRPTITSTTKAEASVSRPTSSFSKRLADARSTTQERQDKSHRLDSIRSKTFSQLQSKDIVTAAPTTAKRLIDSRPVILQPRPSPPKRRANCKDSDFYDPFSELHLSSRSMSHTDVAKQMVGCEIYTIPRLLKEVKSPEYDPPACESDYVVFGILAEKTSPFQQNTTARLYDKRANEDETRIAKNKFMVLRICDLKWEIDCYLFGTGFEQYWKLTEGTLLAILNPAIMPPKSNQHSGRFSLKITSSEDRIMEVGLARDLGYCISVKKDGKKCTAWVNKRKSQNCEFHVNAMIGSARKGRMEVNAMWRGKSPDRKPKEKQNPNVQHSAYGQIWSVGGAYGRSAARLIDDDDTDALHDLSRDEASRKRIAAAQRERDLAKQLGATGGGVAGDYLRARHGISNVETPSQREAMFVKPTAAELGLLSKKAGEQRLSPAKDRRRHFGLGAVSSAGTEALGWGGARKSNLLQTKVSRLGSPEPGQTRINASVLRSPERARSASPKKARFMLDKGIRRPGRESGGSDLMKNHELNEHDDDDELDIV